MRKRIYENDFFINFRNLDPVEIAGIAGADHVPDELDFVEIFFGDEIYFNDLGNWEAKGSPE